jgi:hypothetical protein
MIKPTVGRVVHYWERQGWRGPQPQAAMIAYVHADDLVNLTVLRPSGETVACQSVRFWGGAGERPGHAHWEWMEFQKGQQARTEALEAQLAHQQQDALNQLGQPPGSGG